MSGLPTAAEFANSVASYTFYLDEMIAMRNRAVVAKLEDQGQAPVLAPESVLRAPVQLIQPPT